MNVVLLVPKDRKQTNQIEGHGVVSFCKGCDVSLVHNKCMAAC